MEENNINKNEIIEIKESIIKDISAKEVKLNNIKKNDDKLKLEDNKKIKIEEKVKLESKFEICTIKYTKNNKVVVDFKGYGISIDLGENVKLNPSDKNVKVFYQSDIGKSDFKFWIEEN